jgi:uroporphyrinogen decarboxylase
MLTRITRRSVLAWCAAPAFAKAPARASLSSKERVDRALSGRDLDRPPFTLWHHFGVEQFGPQRHAEATLAFHRDYGTDLVKVMSDFPYPKPNGPWWRLNEEPNPFAAQIQALDIIRTGLGGKAHFVETIFNPWNVAEKLSSKQAIAQAMRLEPRKLLDALAVIARSEANHARRAIAAGASGIFLAIANADPMVMNRDEYRQFSEPFDRIVLEAAKEAPLNVLHLHGGLVHFDLFQKGWPGTVINYSTAATGMSMESARSQFDGVLMGGIDEAAYGKLTLDQLREQAAAARKAGGPRFILAPGCSVPNDSKPEELARMKALFA